MGRPPEAETVRRKRDFLAGIEPYSLNEVAADSLRKDYVVLCDSWLAQREALTYYAEQRNLHRDFWPSHDSYDNEDGLPGARARSALAAGGETETPPERTTP